MIPRRVIVRGFLSYRDEAEVDFTGADLWMLAGANGSGKSAVFDAVTYALFGRHRGGASGADELLNKDADSFTVDFEFALGAGVYRARKTLKRTKAGKTSASQQILQHDGSSWATVPDTGAKAGFDKWVRDHIGLTYETFTSSVLLLQNRAERLIDATPKDRFTVLAGIVDLDRYVRLHQRADDERKTLKTKIEGLKSQRELVPPVKPGEIEALQKQIEAADAARQDQDAELTRRREIESRSKDWADVQQRIASFRQQSEKNIALLKEADAIERDLARLVELRSVVPHVEAAFKHSARLQDGESKAKSLAADVAKATADFEAADQQLTQRRGERENLRTQLASADQELQAARAGESKSAAAVARLDRYEEKHRESEDLAKELKGLPDNLPGKEKQLQIEADSLAEIADALPALKRIAEHRRQLAEWQPALQQGEADLQILAVDGKKAAATATALTTQVAASREAKAEAQRGATEAQTLLRHAEKLLADVDSLSGSAACTYCGQPLTADHLNAERAKRLADRDTAKRQAADRASAVSRAEQALNKFDTDLTRQNVTVESLRKSYSEKIAELAGLRTRMDGAKQSLDADRQALTESYRRLVDSRENADAYPSAGDLNALQSRLDERPRLRAELDRVKADVVRREVLQKKHDEVSRLVETLRGELGADPGAIRQEQARVAAEAQTRQSRFDAVKKQEKESQTAVEQLAERRQELRAAQTRATTEHALAKQQIEHDRQLLDATYAALPDSWRDRASRARLAEVNALKSERDLLTHNRTEERASELAGARTGHEALRMQLEGLHGEEGRIPPEARVPHPVAAMQVAEAKKLLGEREAAVADLRKQLGLLEHNRDQQASLTSQIATVERQHKDAELLAVLLGRDRLQRHLVRQAERQIVGFANAVLDRLSEGYLCLRLRGGEDDDEPEKALELESFNRATGKDSIGIAFLSGSQKFRVAVSLALAIGQFASRRHRPIETVIIDEGFGCLDRVGRQAMIQELNNLRCHLKCILLVSHQEEFADAFPHGYRFELVDGTTQVTRVVR